MHIKYALEFEALEESFREQYTPESASLEFIYSKLKSIPFISKMSIEDRQIFNKFFWKNEGETSYGNSWSYLTQGTFFGAWKYYDGKTAIAITTRFPGMWPFVIVKATGARCLEKIAELAKTLKEISGVKVIVKNLSSSEFEFLKSHGFTDYIVWDCWSTRSKYDDDTFPEVLLNISGVLALKGGKFKLLKYRMKKLKQKHRILVDEFKPIMFNDGMKVWRKWAFSFLKRFKTELTANPLDAHSLELHKLYISSLSSAHDGKNVFSCILYVDGKPHGFALAEKISSRTIGIYSNISSNAYQGISECLLYSLLFKASKAGFTHANLGGSEFESLFKFKKKFAPTLVQKTHAVLYYSRNEK